MTTTETKVGKTPNGGTKSKIIYQDAGGQPVDKGEAVKATIIEYDDKDEEIARTYGTLGNK